VTERPCRVFKVQRRSRNSVGRERLIVTIYLLVPLLLPLFFTAVLWDLTIESPNGNDPKRFAGGGQRRAVSA
jgi:hypothetical protein